MKITDLLSGTKILAETHSKYNGKIQVIRDFTWGTYIKVDGITQSGGILTKIWQSSLKKVLLEKPKIKNCLILGLGGGSVAKLVSQYWIGATITGVDIDEKMINLGKKYLGLNKQSLSLRDKINIKIEDASDFVFKSSKLKTENYDLILVDLYCGDKFPDKFEKNEFIKNIKDLLGEGGIAIFNRLYGGEKRPISIKFGQKLEKIFKKVDYIFPQANMAIVCYN